MLGKLVGFCRRGDEGGIMVGVGICGCGEESDGGMSARERVGEEVSKAN